jgi:tRNA-dihydrouridine synthase
MCAIRTVSAKLLADFEATLLASSALMDDMNCGCPSNFAGRVES